MTPEQRRQRGNVVALVAGLVFAIGLGVAGMTDPRKVLNFLDVFGEWDPSLAFVMGGAILVYAPLYQLVKGKGAPRIAERFHLPTKQDIDAKLVVGSILFGVGWGLGGICPGPAVVAAMGGSSSMLVFLAAMVIGMVIHELARRRTAAAQDPRPADD